MFVFEINYLLYVVVIGWVRVAYCLFKQEIKSKMFLCGAFPQYRDYANFGKSTDWVCFGLGHVLEISGPLG